MGTMLRAGDTLPPVTLDVVGGDPLRLPQDLTTDFGVLLLYRGHW